MTIRVDEKLKDAYMLSQYRRALPFHPQCGTVGINPSTLFTVLVTVPVYPKYLVSQVSYLRHRSECYLSSQKMLMGNSEINLL